MKDFFTATEAKSKTYESLDKAIEQELLKVQKQIQDAVDNGDFSVEWELSPKLEDKHISRIIETLNTGGFVVYTPQNRLVSSYNDELFENSETLTIDWQTSLESAKKTDYIMRKQEAMSEMHM